MNVVGMLASILATMKQVRQAYLAFHLLLLESFILLSAKVKTPAERLTSTSPQWPELLDNASFCRTAAA